ncbi:MAG TPA: putative sulfate exporter family transporter [Roseiflexaceae bacterium]|nr:putative sulfate exporter family transporter [Roseiflexaceae bacterium]
MAQAESLAQPTRQTRIPYLVVSTVVLVVLALLTNQITKVAPRELEFPIWAALLGLVANLVATATGLKERISGAFRTEFFLKTGLVLLGVSVDITKILSVGARGLVQAAVMIVAVFFFTWWLGGVFQLDKKLRAVLSAAVAVCGVSAAIAATGAVLAKKEQLAYVSTLVILASLPLMVLLPVVASTLGLSAQWAGAWFGGNIDTTAAVVGAGTIYGEEAVQIASIVKLSQNALMGLVAFLLATYWVVREEGSQGERPGAAVIWQRFPKFVIGFFLASVVVSLGLLGKQQVADVNALRQWALTLAFISIGWEISFGEIRAAGWRPIGVYLAATVFNTLLALGVAWVLFGQG